MCFYQNIDSCSLYGSNLIIKRRKKIGKFIFWHKIPTAPITVLRWWWYNTYTSNYYYVLQSNITAASWGRIQFIQNISHTIDIDIQLQKYSPIKYKHYRTKLFYSKIYIELFQGFFSKTEVICWTGEKIIRHFFHASFGTPVQIQMLG